MDKTIYSISELIQLGYPEKTVREAVNGAYGNLFARRTSPRGKWLINREKFEKYWNNGALQQEGRRT